MRERRLIVEFAGDNNNLVVQNLVHQPMFISNAAAPMARPIMLEGFGLAESVERVAQYIGNKGIKFLEHIFVCFSPFTVLCKGGFLKSYVQLCAAHSSAHFRASSTLAKVIVFSSLIALFRCLRLAGVLMRYSVASSSRTSISTIRLGYAVLTESIKALSASSLVSSLYVVIMLTSVTATAEIGKG